MSVCRVYQRPTRSVAVLLALLGSTLASGPAVSQSATSSPLTLNGDLRAGYYASHRNDRDGSESEREDFRARLRLGAVLRLNDRFSLRLRAAGRFSTDQESFDFLFRGHAPTVDGLALGQATFDEAYFSFKPSGRLNVRAGRFQSKFALADLLGKSFDRGDSPNTDISWTDGAHLTARVTGGWNTHLILQHNSSEGPSNVVRAPLDVSGSRSRVTYFGAIENTETWGPVVQRTLDVTYIPGALHVGGIGSGGDGSVEDYVAFLARGAVAWPAAGGRLLLGGEAGYAPNTPSRAAVGLGGAGDRRVGGTAYQVGVTLEDAIEGHRVGLVFSEAEAGWLIAPDCRNNDSLIEVRYQWQFARDHSFEARFRDRHELERGRSASERREDLDIYLRVTSRF